MVYLIIKAVISGVVVMAASEIARRSPTYGALLVSLPLTSILAMAWLWRDTGNSGQVAALSYGTFWFLLPTLPMFLVLPSLIRHGVDFWMALAMCCVMTIGLYGIALWFLPRLGISL